MTNAPAQPPELVTIPDPAIPEVKLIRPRRHGDSRGFFVETYSRKALLPYGIDLVFVQDNHSRSATPGTVRGLHYQSPPFAQDKLVRCSAGRLLDIAVDIRRGSPTFGRHVAVELSAENGWQLLVPVGFAHGFATLDPGTDIQYKVSADYSPEHDRGLAWDDPALGIDWRIDPAKAVLSDKDRRQPTLADLASPFAYGETS